MRWIFEVTNKMLELRAAARSDSTGELNAAIESPNRTG
jgi:hypothetical protein